MIAFGVTHSGEIFDRLLATCLLHPIDNGVMLPTGAGIVFDMSWQLQCTTMPVSGGRQLKIFDDVDTFSRDRLPKRYIKILIFLMSCDSLMFDDITVIDETEVRAAYER